VEVLLPVAEIRYRIEMPGYEIFWGTGVELRGVPVELIEEGAAPQGMVRIPAGSEAFRDPGPVAVDAFWLDRYEVTNAQFKEFVDAGGYRNADYWQEEIIVDGHVAPLKEALERFADTTGRPGPAGWELGSYPEGEGSFPVGGVSWYEANAYAAWAEKSLPTVFHWYRAAEQGLFSNIIMVSNIDGKGPAEVGSFPGIGPFGTFDMAGNVREWSLNKTGGLRYILGGGWPDPRYRYSEGEAADPMERAPKNGFRCMKTVGEIAPETTVAVEVPAYDFRQTQPVGDDVFPILKGFFAYDRTELDEEIEAMDDSSEHWRRERITFKAAYGDERVPAYLYLPKNAEPPYQTVVFFPSSVASMLDHSRNPQLFIVSFIIRSGRALIYPIYKGTYERRLEGDWGPNSTRDLIIQASKDMRRSIDYLETRDDIDSEKLAFCGLSWGASWGPLFTAVEDRFKASLLLAGGMGRYPPDRPPESIPANFMPRSTVPVLMVNGRDDFGSPVETELKPMLELQGAPAEHKRLVLLAGGHVPDSPIEFVREALDWLDLYLGPVE
jgi:dienelactone hydrolase